MISTHLHPKKCSNIKGFRVLGVVGVVDLGKKIKIIVYQGLYT